MNEINPINKLGDTMFDLGKVSTPARLLVWATGLAKTTHLESGVHFEEIERTRSIVDQELNRAHRPVFDRRRERTCSLPQLVPQFGVLDDEWTWGLFQDFLVTPLDRTLSFAEPQNISEPIAKDLAFDVPDSGCQNSGWSCVSRAT